MLLLQIFFFRYKYCVLFVKLLHCTSFYDMANDEEVDVPKFSFTLILASEKSDYASADQVSELILEQLDVRTMGYIRNYNCITWSLGLKTSHFVAESHQEASRRQRSYIIHNFFLPFFFYLCLQYLETNCIIAISLTDFSQFYYREGAIPQVSW